MSLPGPNLSESTRAWAKIGVLSFGGPAAQIALMHKVVVEQKSWLKEQQFLNALNFCMLLPGPEAMQLATYAGWRMHGLIGGLIAGLLFVVPGAIVILALAAIYSSFGEVPLIQALFLGIKAAVLVIVLEALLKVSKRALLTTQYYVIAALAFVGIFFFALPYPLIILAAALWGFFRPTTEAFELTPTSDAHRTSLSETVGRIVIWLAVWWIPILALWLGGANQILVDISIFFSKLAVVTFGGAYAVLAYMAQDVVTINGWLTATEMVDGLGLAETTPGPLILVTEFVGFLAANREGGFWLGVAGAAITLWVTFIPCFLWIFVGAPYIEWLSAQSRLKGALSAITAAVVGVILNLSIWFAIHVLFGKVDKTVVGPLHVLMPDLVSIDWRAFILALAAAIVLLGLRWNMILTLALSALGGLALSLV